MAAPTWGLSPLTGSFLQDCSPSSVSFILYLLPPPPLLLEFYFLPMRPKACISVDPFLVLSVVAVTFPAPPTVEEVGWGEARARPRSDWDLVPPQHWTLSWGHPSPGIHGLLPGFSDSLCASPAKDDASSDADSRGGSPEPQLWVSQPLSSQSPKNMVQRHIQSRVWMCVWGNVHFHAHLTPQTE